MKHLKALGEWGLYALVLATAMSLISWWQTRDMLSSAGDVQIAPLRLPTLGGPVSTLAADPERNTLIYFFAPWCSICRMSIGNLDGINEEYTQIAVIALDYDSVEAVQAFVDEVGLERPVLLGNADVRALFKIKGYPSYYILDRDFNIVSRDMGYTSEMGLRTRAWRAAK